VRRFRLPLLAALVLAAALAWGLHWLWIAARVGAGYAAQVTCSGALLSGQDPAVLVHDYIRHEVTPLGPFLRVTVSASGAEARAFGGLIRVRAIRRPGLGCTLLPRATHGQEAGPSALQLPRRVLDPARAWPAGGAGPAGSPPPAVSEAIERAFGEPGPPAPRRQTKAVLVARDGHLVAERYAPGYGSDTLMQSWSMAKSVTFALVGVLVRDGRLDVHAPAPVPEWRAPGDPRGAITLDELLRMSSGLAFDETYGPTNDVSRMLFLAPDMGAFAARFPLGARPDSVWSYSSGTANIVARIVRDVFHGDLAALVAYADRELFDPVGMTSARFEPDASGTPVGSSYVFMTARDWARFGELFRRDGVWEGRRILPVGWVRYATTPTPAAPLGCYGALWWLNAGSPEEPERRPWPSIPSDVYAARGHSGQWVVVVPSARLVVVRLGLTVPDVEAGDGTEQLVADLLHVWPATGHARPRRSPAAAGAARQALGVAACAAANALPFRSASASGE
jgi:CubicO group peptidase (beta-lactamase class C family)